MEIEPNREDSMVLLYQAAVKGCVTTLNTLIQSDPLILNKVSLTSFTETPLHISALLGHFYFASIILELNPKLASDCDSLKRSPLHLASAEGHTEIVKALLCVKKDVCLVRDQDGKIPLHFAAMRGRVEVIQELVSTCPESIRELLDGDTVLHLCVKFNQLEALKLLVTTLTDKELDDELLRGNQDGNTILHLSVMLKQLETVKYLLSIPKVKFRANALNRMGFTPLDLLKQRPRDFKSLQIQELLMEAGDKTSSDLKNTTSLNPAVATSSNKRSKVKSAFRKCLKYLKYDHHETRGALMIVATVISTITFQAAMNPPGGVWQQKFTNDVGGSGCSEANVCEAGTAVLAYAYPDKHIDFLTYSSYAFVASLSVIALIVGGFPLRNKLCVWVLAQAIGITLVFLVLTYIAAVDMVTPSSLGDKIRAINSQLYLGWIGLLFLAASIETIRFVVWIVKMLLMCWLQILKKCANNG